MEVMGKYIVVLTVVIMVFLFPLQYIAQIQNENIHDLVQCYGKEFIDKARHEGQIRLDQYEELLSKLDLTGDQYKIELELSHPVSGKEISDGNQTIETKLGYYPKFTTTPISNHIHTENCYEGHRHTDGEGISSSYYEHGCYTLPFPYYHSCTGYVTAYPGSSYASYCPNCGGSSTMMEVIMRCDTCGIEDGMAYDSWCNSGCGYYQSNSWTGFCSQKIVVYTEYVCGQTEDISLDCGKVVTRIVASEPIQFVKKGDSIISTAIATYLDGHTDTVSCTSNYNPNQIGNQTVTLIYSGLVDTAKTLGIKTCNLQVTVKEENLAKLTGITVEPNIVYGEKYQGYEEMEVHAHYDDGTSKIITAYTVTGVDTMVSGTYDAIISYSEGDITKTTKVTIIIENMKTLCPTCGAVYPLDHQDQDNGCPICSAELIGIQASPNNITVKKGEELPIIVEALYKNGNKAMITDWSSTYQSNLLGYQEVIVSYYGFEVLIIVDVKEHSKLCETCGQVYLLNNADVEISCPVCSKVVVSIDASPSRINTVVNEPLNLVVIATYQDGHQEEVYDWETDYIGDQSGEYEVTIRYQNVTDTIYVTVSKDHVIPCSYCHLEYDFYTSPEGCPVCYYKVIGIEASLRNGGQSVIVNSPLQLEVVLLYQDTHLSIVDSGFIIEEYHPETLGWQTISIIYGEFQCLLNIEVINRMDRLICPKGHEYYLDEDGSDPGCPLCESDLQKENAVFYFKMISTEEIVNHLYQNGMITLQSGDYLTLVIIPKELSKRYRIQNMLLGTARVKKNPFIFSGEVFST